MNNSQHFKSIDQLRGIAILMVLVSHSYGYSLSISPVPPEPSTFLSIGKTFDFLFHRTFANGFLGVMIFFVLSGFCIRWSHLKMKNFTWKNFYHRRFFRIIPAYWVWLAVGAALAQSDIRDILLHALLLHNFDANSYHSIIAPFWSIAIEWQIYLIYPILVLLTERLSRFSVLVLFTVTNLGSALLSSNAVAEMIESDMLKIFGRLPTALLLAWMLGFYLADDKIKKRETRCSYLLLFMFLLVGILAYLHPKTCFLAAVPWSFAAYQLVALFLAGKIKWPFKKFDCLTPIGIISYSVYLSHDFFAKIYPKIESTFQLGRGSFAAGATSTAILVLPMLLVGWISYRLLEVPGAKLGKFLGSR
jgi:peptidoglycan/LPS O-acetylase OafA/YrhL